MKTYKRIIASIFVLTMTIGVLTGCGDTAGEKSTDDTTITTTTAAQTEDTTTTAALEETTTSVTTTVTEKETPESEADTETITEVPESSANVGIETMADNPEGRYPVRECFRRRVEEISESSVIDIEYDENIGTYVAICENNNKYALENIIFDYENDEICSLNHFYVKDNVVENGNVHVYINLKGNLKPVDISSEGISGIISCTG